jgi:CHAT domain-containing protein
LKRIFSCTILFLFSFTWSFGQTSGFRTLKILIAYRKADQYYKKALQVSRNTAGGEDKESLYNSLALKAFSRLREYAKAGMTDSLLFFIDFKIGELYHYFDSLQPALAYYNKAIQLETAYTGLPDSLFFKPHLFAGHIYFYLNQLDSATYHFKKAEHIQENQKSRLQESERLYNDLGVLYYQGGNFRQAANYFSKAAYVLPRSNPFYTDFYVNYQINFATALFKLGILVKADSILRALLPYHKLLNEIYNNLGLIAEKKGLYVDAIHLYGHIKYANVLDIGLENDKARSWLLLGKLDSAYNCTKRAFQLHQIYDGSHTSIDHGLTYKVLGDLRMLQKNYNAALEAYQRALHQFYPSYKDITFYSNPKKFTGVFSYINVFNALVAKADAFHSLLNKTKDLSMGVEELHCYDAALRLIDYIESVYDSDEARLFLERSKFAIHSRPVEIAMELYQKTGKREYLDKAYEMDQRNKASVLGYHDFQNQLIHPSSPLQSEESRLKKEITRLNLSAAALADPNAIDMNNSRIRELEIQLGKVQDAIERSYPSVHVSIPLVKTLQTSLLDPTTMLISYHIGDKVLTVFIITRSSFHAIQKAIYKNFQEDLHSFVDALHHGPGIVPDNNLTGRLSSFLLDGIVDKAYSRIIIIPENELDYLPFEALQNRQHYLLEDFAIQYQYSTVLLKKDLTNFRNAFTTSFAPFSQASYEKAPFQFEQLEYSASEVKGLRGTVFQGTDATKDYFLKYAREATIVHLATHALVGDSTGQSSFIAFAPWKENSPSGFLLYVPEIYDLRLHNKLFILSACETGTGKLIKGEGVMSISRAFAYAGCPNIIASLWKADDESTAYIARDIHVYLEKGFPVDLAVRQAKKDYLADKTINPHKKLPYYWSHLIFIGNYRPEPPTSLWLWLIASLAILLETLLCIPYFIRKARVRKLVHPSKNLF